MFKSIKNFKVTLGYKSLVAISIFLAGIGTGIVFASVPDSNGVIHTCYRNALLQKTFRVIDSATDACNANETSLTWAQSGRLLNVAPGSHIAGAPLIYRDFTNANLTSVDFGGANVTGSDFTNANFTNASIDGLNGAHVNLTGINMTGMTYNSLQFTYSELPNFNFNNRTITGTSIVFSNLTNSNVSNSTLNQVSFQSSNLTNVNFSNSTFVSNSSLLGSTLTNANVSGVDWGTDTICPDATVSENNGNTCVGHLIP